MATAPQDAHADISALSEVPHSDLLELFERERQGWLDRLLWDTLDGADLALSAVSSRIMDGAALRRGARWDGFVSVQPSRPLTRLCGGWMHASVTASEAIALVRGALRRVPARARIEGQLVAFETQALFDVAFAAAGFSREPREYLVADLDAAALPPLPRDRPDAGEHRLLSVDALLLPDCARVLVDAHRGSVEAVINAAFRSERGAREYLQDIVANMGCGQAIPEGCLAAVRGGIVEGFCMATMISPGIGHVPQVAVSPAAQGLGLGSTLLSASQRALVRRGARRVTLSVSVANGRAAGWYGRLGFRPATRFSAYYRD